MTAPRPDVRLETAAMQPVACGSCGAQVLVRKSSWDQTTVQWNGEALALCAERRRTTDESLRPNHHAFTGCSALRSAIQVAAVRGDLDIVSDEPLPTHPEAHP